MNLNLLKKLFNPSPSALSLNGKGEVSAADFKVVVADFYDNISSNGAINLASALNCCEGITAVAYTEDFNHAYLDFESRNIFDLIELGQTILRRTSADILIWGCRDKNYIRLHFQNKNLYEDGENSFVSLMDCFYLPADLLDEPESVIPETMLTLLYGATVSTANAGNKERSIYKKYLLKKVVHKLSQADSIQTADADCLPYIYNFIGIIYLSVAWETSSFEDFKVIREIFESALQCNRNTTPSIHLGCVYYHLAELYDCASRYMGCRSGQYFRGAIKYYQSAQKYLSKYTYPYDYGYVCYKLSELYVNYWKQAEDSQALRDAVFQLREAEKVYTQALFPDFWSRIEGQLGYLLHNLAFITQSQEICHLAIVAYQNRQKIITEKQSPLLWAEIQEKIGNINFFLGRTHKDIAFTEEALACFHDSLYIYETHDLPTKIKQLKFDISRAYQTLEELKLLHE